MSKLMLLVAIVDCESAERCVTAFSHHGVAVIFESIGLGTATSEMLQILGLNNTEKVVIFAVIRSGMTDLLMDKITRRQRSVAFTVPMSSVVGDLSLKEYIAEREPGEQKGETEMNARHSVVITIANRGYLDTIMQAARKAGATGGTMIHAKGAGTQAKEKFFGVSFAEEKEIIFIVAEEENRASIMKAISHEAGLHSKAKAMVFSLPVEDVAGFSGFFGGDAE